ncbi:sodium:proton antiporter [Bdellovibrio bacteriovorus]|uniref:Sodium:proton antiporter n=1 Tax=Bdellovibrio bacteriovorus TaxID=959 RepID=A0A150WI06_BDEBC|nr:cation:proton antiporter [Bdellovibrio bacteriovorus]KYG63244.1 sodium:proton antiporter [Bdellovibrio bacteriovorus]
MQHLPSMITDLALILGTAGIVTLLFKKLNQPIVLGYLVAGFLVGPKTSIFPTIVGQESISLWAEIGVIFLLFALGLEFSFKKLFRVGGSAGFTALFEISFMVTAGYVTGRLLGWTSMDSMFLGGILAISSTSIIIRTIEELGFKNFKFVGMVFGILVIEDLVAVLLMVLLTTVALTRDFAGAEMLGAIVKLSFFLSIWFVAGIFLLPSFLKRAQKLLTEETVLVVAVGLCLLMVVFASNVGFSSALGAFIMGSILAETIEGERIHHLVKPIKNLFSAVFFISVGMMIDPQVIMTYWKEVLLLSSIVIVGKTISVTLGSVLSGQSLKSSLQSGMSLSQIGEFSFIIATLGLSLKVINENMYPLAVAVSVVTAFTTPYMMRSSTKFYAFLERILPPKVVASLDSYSVLSFSMQGNRVWRDQVRAYIIKIILNAVVVVAIFLLTSRVFLPFLLERQMAEGPAKFLSLSATLIASAPFLWALAFGRTKDFDVLVFDQNKGTNNYVFLVSRIMLAVGLLGAMVAQFVPIFWALAITLWMVIVVGYILSQKLNDIYHWFEHRFLSNLNDEVQKNHARKAVQSLAPWDAHMTEFQIPPEAPYVGVPLSQLSIREVYGVTIALIERGRRRITAPGRNECLMPHDHIHVIGTDAQLVRFKDFIQSEHEDLQRVVSVQDDGQYTLESYRLSENSPYINCSIRDCGLRESTQGLVVGIERDGRRILNPDSSEVLVLGDVLWIVGDRDKILNQT